jgi:hypothetical protein
MLPGFHKRDPKCHIIYALTTDAEVAGNKMEKEKKKRSQPIHHDLFLA